MITNLSELRSLSMLRATIVLCVVLSTARYRIFPLVSSGTKLLESFVAFVVILQKTEQKYDCLLTLRVHE